MDLRQHNRIVGNGADARNRASLALAISAVMIGLLFAVDILTPLGYAEWSLYVVPIALSIFGGRSGFPLGAAAVCTVLIFLGLWLSPGSTMASVPVVNRMLGAVGIWMVALVGHRFIQSRLQVEALGWLQAGKALVAQRLAGVQAPDQIGENLLYTLTGYTDAVAGVAYRVDEADPTRLLRLAGSGLAVDAPAAVPLGGLTGQVVRENRDRILDPVPADYLNGGVPIASTLGQMVPRSVAIVPITFDGRVNGVIELAFTSHAGRAREVAELLAQCAETAGIALNAALSRIRLQHLLEETQRQGEELQTQQEELRVSNEELEERGNALRDSKELLERQQADLEQNNVQLEEYSNRLEGQKHDLLMIQNSLQENADALTRTNQYKSEFLANMSHELRTPLNSSLILSKLLADNGDGSLSEIQVRYAKTIHSSNQDLLNLINDILDLAKVEAGKADISLEPVALAHLLDPLRMTFEPVAADRRLAFRIEIDQHVPDTITTDLVRFQQVLRNLLSNAFKFTPAGEVQLRVAAGAGRIRFAVRDSGIGIAPEQHEVIFEAFRQADGSTSRQYGGTGLGLSISRELAKLLQGSLTVSSAPDQGSTFTLDLPIEADRSATAPSGSSPPASAVPGPRSLFAPQAPTAPAASPTMPATPVLSPSMPSAEHRDAERSAPEHQRNRTVLIIEDDPTFAGILADLARELDLDSVVTASAERGLALARELEPSGILLDVGLPDRSGLTVLEQLKRDPKTRPIPVHIVSASDHTRTALELGAIGYVMKPALRGDLVAALQRVENQTRRMLKSVLIVEDDATLRENLVLLLTADGVELVGAGSVTAALALHDKRSFDCMVMDLGLPDGSGYELLERLSQGGRYAFPPVIVYTGRQIGRDEEQRLRRYSQSIIIKGARSPERLVDEVTLFLHQVESSLPADQQRLLRMARSRDSVLDGRRILLAEDDVRNVFALINVLEPLGAQVEIARNGREALDKLAGATPGIDLVLMDIMMPVMDGFAAMRAIRADPLLVKVPIIALTANAMPEDRIRCLEAGADDYISKPIDIDRLVSLCRVWMPK